MHLPETTESISDILATDQPDTFRPVYLGLCKISPAMQKPDSAVDKESVHASDDETSFMAQPFPLSPVYSPDSPSKKDGSDLESESPRQENSPIDANTLSPVVYIQNSHTKKRSWLPTF
ncbi:hypothetical protein AVEN_241568-1 [Araneus ventricosus]|uniref:Uncharacterized protein n=1 Tax=Araneus ventricosus TaxID=182803 RepID=A0A4Y2RPX9_ARAVE|nr:hypothetical protein AVEN_241568-1 [Araneus ventricosus]